MKIAYLSCIGGISGDMFLGALIDSGVDVKKLNEGLSGLNINGLELTCGFAERGGMRGTQVSVHTPKNIERPWKMQELIECVERSDLQRALIVSSCDILRRLWEAEASVHGVSLENVELHELGDLDTLADVVGSVLGLHLLGIERLYSSPIPSGSGITMTAHGKISLPSPVASELFAMSKALVVPPPGNAIEAGEMVTPTGAAIVTTLATFEQPAFTFNSVGYGLGMRDPMEYPNVLAIWTGEQQVEGLKGDFVCIETNIDDMNPEILGYVQERLFETGALDVWLLPIQMKKNRPGVILNVLAPKVLEAQLVGLILRETSSLGVRVRPIARYEAVREIVEVETSLGMIPVKIKNLGGVRVSVSPEYEVCQAIATTQNLTLKEVYRIVENEASDKLL